MKYHNGESYEGNWANGKLAGHVMIQLVNGDTYEGEFLNGLRHGNGRYNFNHGKYSGDYYVGQFANNKRNGHGTYYFEDGRKCEGPWTDDNLHG